jgi:ATP-binding cassette subfamily B protein
VKNLKHLNKYFVKYKWYLLLGIVFVAASNYFKVLIPRAVREAIDLVVEAIGLHTFIRDSATSATWETAIGRSLMYYGLLVFAAAVITGIFMYFMRQTIIVMSRLIEYDLRDEIFKHYTTLDQSFMRRNQTGDLMSRISEDVSKVRMYLGPGLLYTINLISLFVLVIYTMFQVNAKLTLFTLLPLPFLSISIYYISSIINKKSFVIQKQLSKLTSVAQEVYSGIRVVKSYVQESSLGDYFEEESEVFKEKSLDLAKVNAYFFPLMVLMIGISTITTIYVGGYLAIRGEVSAGNIAEFVIYVNMLTWPVTAIGWIASIVQQAEASQERINEFLWYEPEISSKDEAESTLLKGNVVFDDVSFVYPDNGIKALSHISFELKAGSSLAIVGRTASGKTTIADLLFRLFDPTSGHIYIDGIDLKDWNLSELRRQMAYVPQDVFLFSDTVAENIRFGDSSLTQAELENFARLAVVDKDIDELPIQYKTRIGERGVSLSGGQKQRISLARGLIQNPGLLVLDDCLSAVDAMTEHKIIGQLEGIMKGKTTIFITHRLNALPLFDHIIVLDEGKIKESGTHDELLANEGLYFEIFEQQNLETQQM